MCIVHVGFGYIQFCGSMPMLFSLIGFVIIVHAWSLLCTQSVSVDLVHGWWPCLTLECVGARCGQSRVEWKRKINAGRYSIHFVIPHQLIRVKPVLWICGRRWASQKAIGEFEQWDMQGTAERWVRIMIGNKKLQTRLLPRSHVCTHAICKFACRLEVCLLGFRICLSGAEVRL